MIAWRSLGSIGDIKRVAEERFQPEVVVHPDEGGAGVYREGYRRFRRLLDAVKQLFTEFSA